MADTPVACEEQISTMDCAHIVEYDKCSFTHSCQSEVYEVFERPICPTSFANYLTPCMFTFVLFLMRKSSLELALWGCFNGEALDLFHGFQDLFHKHLLSANYILGLVPPCWTQGRRRLAPQGLTI